MDEHKTEWSPGNSNDRSITGFRIRNGSARGPMSKKFFYKMDRAGLGPVVKTVFGRKTISPAAELAWQEAQDIPISDKVKLARSEARSRAARLGLQSPNHPANVKRRLRGGR
jgi:hypothetical protein